MRFVIYPFENRYEERKNLAGNLFNHYALRDCTLSTRVRYKMIGYNQLAEQNTAIVFFWSLVGGLIMYVQKPLYRLSVGGGSLLLLLGIYWFIFIQNGWLPLILSGLAFLISVGVIFVISNFLNRTQG